MRTCVHHGDSATTAAGEEAYICTAPTGFLGYSCLPGSPCGTVGDCFVALPALPAAAPEPEKVPDSTPVTFADVLRYHRRLAQDPRADRAWHEEAVLVLFLLSHELYRACGEETCIAMPYDGPRCHRDLCPVWQARKAVEVET